MIFEKLPYAISLHIFHFRHKLTFVVVVFSDEHIKEYYSLLILCPNIISFDEIG